MSEGDAASRVGYALEPKKVHSFIQPSLLHYAKQNGIDLIQIDLTTPLSQQGPFHCIIHKLNTQNWKKQLQEFSTQHPKTVIIDPPELINRLHNRLTMLESVTHLHLSIENENFIVEVPKQVVVKEPKSFDLGAIEELGLRFPVIAKPLEANSTVDSHNLFLVFDFDGVKSLNNPMMLQEFTNHGGVVFKIYVAGKHFNCVKRKSLCDISEENMKTVKGSVPFSQVSNLSAQNYEEGVDGDAVDMAEMPPQSLIAELASGLRERLGLNLFNVDVIRDGKNPRRYLVIDINYFPGYAKLPSFEPFFTDFLLDVVQQTKTD
ncbi:putative phosphotransferase with an alcohol group as acceptor [Medicago truncatula]|uniref:Inositol-tetrakisphosphate 1-kinase n=1 Tax=Medicago truncatula TaxID=3880 RepID=A0A072UR73_MEDTR|nr:inositol-tetrakisphosphate 1-kinase 1 [Medicago truncatula]KEH31841.1 inositol 1,3,4-trisphosphate 5/6-kinase [Medicago truncatula]RHN63509.1 putative phosphotransferase with an alcohol group as acceptor [Medicago truncatula]